MRVENPHHMTLRGQIDHMSSETGTLASIIQFLRCPRCGYSPLEQVAPGVACPSCSTRFPLYQGILDTMGDARQEVITPFQRVMQTPIIVAIYERVWRRIGYYLASSRSFAREIETVVRCRRGREDARILDLACGPGVFTRPLARESNGLVVGLDLSRPMLQHARRLLQHAGLGNVLLVRGTAFHLPFVDGTFSYVNCCGALHLFDRPDDALAEIARVLVPDGQLCVQTTIRPARSAGLADFLERFIRFGFFEEDDLRMRMTRSGFEFLESERHRISFTFRARRTSRPPGKVLS
jgi:SAM-dependent methyltransferase